MPGTGEADSRQPLLDWIVSHKDEPHDQLEDALVAAYCARNCLTPSPTSRLAVSCERVSHTPLLDAAAKALPTAATLDDLVMAFETLVPQEDAKLYGATFTPAAVTRFMAREATMRLRRRGGQLDEAKVIDPSVGCGALLLSVLQEIVGHTGERPSTVTRRLFGVDISEDSVRRAHLLIDVACLQLGDPNEGEATLVVDSSLDPSEANPLLHHSFDIVIANPPYVRYQLLPDSLRRTLPERFESVKEGNFNLYFPFFELSARVLAPDGVGVFITPNGFFTSKSGASLRRWFRNTRTLDTIVDFKHYRVFEAMTYTAISVLEHPKKPIDPSGKYEVGYVAAEGLVGLSRLTDGWQEGVARSPLPKDDSAWSLVDKSARGVVALVSRQTRSVADLAEVSYGIATCRDRLFFLSGARDDSGLFVTTHRGEMYSIEEDITRRCVKIPQIRDEAGIENSITRVIYPYRIVSGRALAYTEEELSDLFPQALVYLRAVKGELESRDKGKKKYAQWFAYGRTQGLLPSHPKLLTPLYANNPRFMYAPQPDLLFLNGCSVTVKPDSPIALRDLHMLLNSDLCRDYIAATSTSITGGFYAYQKTQIGRFRVPHATDEMWTDVREASGEERESLIRRMYSAT